MSVSHVSLCFPVTGKRSGAVCVYVSPPVGKHYTLHRVGHDGFEDSVSLLWETLWLINTRTFRWPMT